MAGLSRSVLEGRGAFRATITHGEQPLRQGEEASYNKERTEDCLVVTGKPVGQVDVEVVRGFRSKAGGEIGERTAETIQGEDKTLEQDDGGKKSSEAKSVHTGGEGNCGDAGDKEEPDGSVQELDDGEHGLRVGLHGRSPF